MARILVVDDEPAHRDSLRRIFERAGHEVLVADDGQAALAVLRNETVAVLLTDLVMPRMDGLALLKAARALSPEIDVIMMTAYGTVENAVAAMREGAYDFIVKPTKRAEVLACLARILEKQALVHENRALRAELAQSGAGVSLVGILGDSAAMEDARRTVAQAAPSHAAVLVVGESGTGKELCARAVHALSPRAQAPFVPVSCGVLPEAALDAELFGSADATSVSARRPGCLVRATGGTLFLDEVSEIPLALQVKLLRALEEGRLEAETAAAPTPVDVRSVASSRGELLTRVKEGRFREDLFYRLAVVTVALPPLRERRSDLPLLAMHFLRRMRERHGKHITGIAQRALDALLVWSYPGNVRELENVIERAVVLAPGDTLRLEDLPPDMRTAAGEHPRPVEPERGPTLTFRVGTTLEHIERAAIDATLKHTGGDKALTAKLLGVSLRTLYRRVGERGPDEALGDDAP